MSDAKRRFIRIYYTDLQRDYPEVWFDPTAGWTFTRLLSLADQAWPAKPELYRAVRRTDLALLERVGLVTLLSNSLFVIKGYESERSERADKARASVRTRYDRTTTVERSKYDRSTAHSRALDTGVTDTGSSERDDGSSLNEPFPAIDTEAITFLEGITHRLIRQAGDKQLAEYDRQIAAHGLPAVIHEYQRVAKSIRGTPTAAQLVWSGMKLLEPFVDPRDVADAEKGQRPRAIRPPRDEAAIRAERLRLIEPGATA